MQKLVKDIFIETKFAGVTVGAVVGPEGIICIDAPTQPADARAWRQQLEQTTGKTIRFVVVLDQHRDRNLGCQWLEAPVVAHEQTYERLRTLPDLYKNSPAEPGADAELVDDVHGLRVILPQIVGAQRMVLRAGERELHLVHRPGVAPGALWVELPAEGLVFTGDAVTHKVPPVLAEADLTGWLAGLADLRKTRWLKTVIPGRGSAIHKDGLKPLEDVLKLAHRKVEALVKSKKPRTELEAVARELLGKYTVPVDLRAHYARRLRAGLEHVYDRRVTPAR